MHHWPNAAQGPHSHHAVFNPKKIQLSKLEFQRERECIGTTHCAVKGSLSSWDPLVYVWIQFVITFTNQNICHFYVFVRESSLHNNNHSKFETIWACEFVLTSIWRLIVRSLAHLPYLKKSQGKTKKIPISSGTAGLVNCPQIGPAHQGHGRGKMSQEILGQKWVQILVFSKPNWLHVVILLVFLYWLEVDSIAVIEEFFGHNWLRS